LVRVPNSDSDALRGRRACVAGSKPIGGCGLTTFYMTLAATVQTAEISGL
jgi:hypothetical protein